MDLVTIRVEVKVDGRIVRVEEIQVERESNKTTGLLWDFLHRAKAMLDKICVADLMK